MPTPKRSFTLFLLTGAALALAAWGLWSLWQHKVGQAKPLSPPDFDGARAYQDVVHQVSLGPRTPGSSGHEQAVRWIAAEL